jgi:hypothetical protein
MYGERARGLLPARVRHMPSLHKPTPRIPIPQAAAGCIAFAGFAVAIFVGIGTPNPVEVILTRALVAMACGFAVGYAVGLVCDWLVAQEVSRLEALVEADAKNLEMEIDGATPDGVEVLDEDELGVVEEWGGRKQAAAMASVSEPDQQAA